jgi:hypothetical protein
MVHVESRSMDCVPTPVVESKAKRENRRRETIVVYMNALFAVFWFALGVSFFIFDWDYPNGVSAAWLALLLAVYNLLRCVSIYYRRAAVRDSPRIARPEKSTHPSREYYRNLDFSKPANDAPSSDAG